MPLEQAEGFDSLVQDCMKQMLENFDADPVDIPVPASNWRWEKSTKLGPGNKSHEKLVEKLVAYFLDETWVNQVPVCNGVIRKGKANAYRIDLVNQTDDVSYDLIELKYSNVGIGGSNNPLHAAIEILKYAFVYFLFRQRGLLGDVPPAKNHVIQASAIRLVILAPERWYRYRLQKAEHEFALSYLEENLTQQLVDYVGRNVDGLKSVSLVFEKFSPVFQFVCDQLLGSTLAFREDCFQGRIPINGSGI